MSDATAPAPAAPALSYPKLVGTIVIGLFLNTYLYGLVTWQFITYKNTVFKDPFWIKAVVLTLFILDTIHSAVLVYDAWDLCVINFANPAILAVVGWEIPFTAVATAVVAVISQFFLGYRILRLTKSWPIFILVAVLSVVGGVGGIVAGIRSGIIWEVQKFGALEANVIVWLGFQTAADLVITAVLTFALSRSRTGFSKTDHILNRLIRGAVQTGVFVTIFALGDLFSFLLSKDTNLYAMFAFPIGRIYTNYNFKSAFGATLTKYSRLLDTLNSRKSLKSEVIDMDTSNVQIKSFPGSRIAVRTETHTAHDGASDHETKFDAGEVYGARAPTPKGKDVHV